MYKVTITRRARLALRREIVRLEKLATRFADAGQHDAGHQAASDAMHLGRDLARSRCAS